MILRHLHNPAIRITLPSGGALQFEDYICEVFDETVEVNGESFFEQLVLDGKVEIMKESKKPIEIEITEDLVEQVPELTEELGETITVEPLEKAELPVEQAQPEDTKKKTKK